MLDASREIQVMMEKYYSVYTDLIFDPLNKEFDEMESALLEAAASELKAGGPIDLNDLSKSLYLLRRVNTALEGRRLRIERIAIDGPSDWTF